jgi:hypothetical protein
MSAITADLRRMSALPQRASDGAHGLGPFQASLLQRYNYLRPQLLDLMQVVGRASDPDTAAAYDTLYQTYGRIKAQLERLGLVPTEE